MNSHHRTSLPPVPERLPSTQIVGSSPVLAKGGIGVEPPSPRTVVPSHRRTITFTIHEFALSYRLPPNVVIGDRTLMAYGLRLLMAYGLQLMAYYVLWLLLAYGFLCLFSLPFLF